MPCDYLHDSPYCCFRCCVGLVGREEKLRGFEFFARVDRCLLVNGTLRVFGVEECKSKTRTFRWVAGITAPAVTWLAGRQDVSRFRVSSGLTSRVKDSLHF